MAVTKSNTNRAVDNFFRNGTIGKVSESELARACDQRVRGETQRSTVSAIKLGQAFVRQSKKHGGVLYLTALRALGWALLVAGEYRQSEKSYLRARSLVNRQPLERARIDRILIDVYMYLGKFADARRCSRQAISTFQRLNSLADVAKTQVNYANVLHRQDRHKEANRLYKSASDFFAAEKNHLAAALSDYNLANTYVQLFAFADAAERYQSARTTFIQHDQKLYATGCLYGLAWLHMLQGEFHTALMELSECETFYRAGKQNRELVLCLLDRSEAYLGLNLFLDARRAAEEARHNARRLGIAYESAKADFFCGKACLGLGQKRAARASLKRAEQGFKKIDNQGFLAAVQFTDIQCGKPNAKMFLELQSIRKRFQKSQLPLWEAICDIQLAVHWPSDDGALKRLKSNPAVASVPHLQAHQFVLLGDRKADSNNWNDAVDCWSRAAEILDAVRAKLPPVEMRSSFFKGKSDPFRKLIDYRAETDPLEASVWSERHRTAGM
jgi:tetratricopeptide (TPR) repeat protein